MGLENEYRFFKRNHRQADNAHEDFFLKLKKSVTEFLPNGARFYLDQEIPEYCTPECISVREVLAHERAGDLIVSKTFKSLLAIFKRNLGRPKDARKAPLFYWPISGCHENYMFVNGPLIKRLPKGVIFYDWLSDVLCPFLVSRQIFCGGGAIVQFDHGQDRVFLISQRAFFMKTRWGERTTEERSIVNTKGEPLGKGPFVRLHLIVGDSNMSDLSGFLKLGATSIVLRMLEASFLDLRDIILVDPLKAIREIAMDPTCKVKVSTKTGRELSAIDIQQWYLDRANEFFQRNEASEEEKEVMKRWQETLDKLRQDPMLLKEEIDWVIKLNLIKRYCEKHQTDFNDKGVDAIDLYYHSLDQEKSLFYKLLKVGRIKRLISDREIFRALKTPPQDTRAKIRGEFVEFILRKHPRLRESISVDWNEIIYSCYHNYLRGKTNQRDYSDIVGFTIFLNSPFLKEVERNNVIALMKDIDRSPQGFPEDERPFKKINDFSGLSGIGV